MVLSIGRLRRSLRNRLLAKLPYNHRSVPFIAARILENAALTGSLRDAAELRFVGFFFQSFGGSEAVLRRF